MSPTHHGEVVRHVYHKDTFRIMVVRLTEGGREASVLGHFSEFCKGAKVQIVGSESSHPTRGPQIKAELITEIMPTTQEGLVAYLSGGSFAGIGKTYAQRIVDQFGDETEKVLSEEPERLSLVKKVPAAALANLVKEWLLRREMHEIVTYFRKAGLGEALSMRTYEKFKDDAIERVKINPYCLMAVEGIGFSTADNVATNLGLPADSPHRIQAAITCVMDAITDDGDTCITGKELFRRTAKLIPDVENLKYVFMGNLGDLTTKRAIYEESELGEPVYYRFMTHHNETELSNSFVALAKAKPAKQYGDIDRKIAVFEHERSIELSDMQRQAVHMVAKSSVLVVTGGPGTGKTTVLSAILESVRGARVLMAAPTGKAANVMQTATGVLASTIHRLLEWSSEVGEFTRNRRNPLEADVIVIDEVSMLDLPLATSLSDAVSEGSRLILVGDVDQLPSVGPGAVLRDIILSAVVPVVRLSRVYRQGEGSGIAHNAQRILKGEEPKEHDDFFILKGHDEPKAKDRVVKLVSDILPKKFGFSPTKDIQVLVPRHKGEAGRLELNTALQEALNPASGDMELLVGGVAYRKGDRVMQLRNVTEAGVFNGETGIVHEIGKDALTVLFSGERLVEYIKDGLEHLTLAYASTIHKSQGGEFQAVVVVMTSSAGWMLNKNLLYTAITRAKKIVVIVTDDGAKAVKIAVSKSGSERVTKLSERLRKVRSEPQDARDARKEAQNEVDQAMDLWAGRSSFARLAAKRMENLK